MKKYKLAVQTVFLPRENLIFLKEWLYYHTLIGVDHFYLYDNTGSVGQDGSSQTRNKYGTDFAGLTSNLSEVDVQHHIDIILGEFQGKCTRIEWKPRNQDGDIVYAQDQSIRHVVNNFGDEMEWLCSIDMDEYLFSPDNMPIADLLELLGEREISCGVLNQKKFQDRFLNIASHVVDIENCIDDIDTSGWAPKNIVKVDDIDPYKELHVHKIPVVRGHTRQIPENKLRFNHYNVNRDNVHWMKEYYGTETVISLNGNDEGMRRYAQDVHRACEQYGNFKWRKEILDLKNLVASYST